jgi:colanic acid biosynthesis protein WcaH
MRPINFNSTFAMTKLNQADFLKVVDHTPLIAIDLIVPDSQGRFLLGQRVNKPAQGSWFVPGGRIRKNESLDTAFTRLCLEELGLRLQRESASLIGIYEHFYPDNFSGAGDVSTHYIVMGYRFGKAVDLAQLPLEQHTRYRFASAEEICVDPDVHDYSRAYFMNEAVSA